MKRIYILMVMIILAIGMTACSSDPKHLIEDAAPSRTIAGQETENEGAADTKAIDEDTPKAETDVDTEKESTSADGNIEADPITGIVEKYEDDKITIYDPGDGLFYYFSTLNAQIVEGDSHIAVGDTVEITYQGLLGNEEHPGDALKIVAVSVK